MQPSMTSSAEAGPSSRTSLNESIANAPPLLPFDGNLRFLSDCYIPYFIERRKIEETYIESLRKLHKRLKTTDTYFDDRYDPTLSKNTTRAAWAEVRDNLDRECDTRQALVASWSSEVITPLVGLKETQERIRKRIREDLKEAISAHADYAENVFPKLKRSYMKKSQDVEEFKAAAANGAPLSPTAVHEINPFVLPKPDKGSGKPVVTAPQPLRPLDRRPSTHQNAPARNRSPSTSTALSDLAHQGKRQLNQLITFLDKAGNVKDGNRADNALRTVRAKREADDADKEYRKGVHWLETLRLRRIKMLEGGYNSLEAFARELSDTMKRVLVHFSDSVIATYATQMQMCNHARVYIEKINPEKDTALLSTNIPRLLALATPKPLYYDNFAVGECRDLIFGVTLVDYATSKGLADGEVPKIVRQCIDEIESRGLDAEGIYRVSGRHAAVQELQHKIERDEEAFQFNPAVDDVYAVSSLLKLYLRELPEPVFKFSLQERQQHTEEIAGHISSNFRLLRSKIRRLPPVHQATLKAILEHLAKVASHSDKNKMDAKNLAIVFGSVIFGEDDMPKGGDLLAVQAWKDTLMEDLITHAHVLFQSSNSSPPLPPAPSGEPVPALTYGSSHTKVSEMAPPPPPRIPTPDIRTREQLLPHPPPPPPPPQQQQQPTHVSQPVAGRGSLDRPAFERRSFEHLQPPEDFTPQLPSRPANSIHPSLRAGQPGGVRQSLPPPPRSAQWFDENFNVEDVPRTQGPPSVPPSPRRQRIVPAPLAPLKSPWSDSQPSLASTAPTNVSALDVGFDAATLPEEAILANYVSLDDAPPSGPSTGKSFATAISPTASISSSGRRTPATPPPSIKPLALGNSPSRGSISTQGSTRHRQDGSSSSESP
ncbi:RhoGAP-domain-containing protein [Phanerochaete sordida]|uniref:RhoGAP-domain-containing protein n=1 Tax=Phanerochaete sordida TaxID=48140 RepID=A0A9P3G0Y4_9APHY|nr:RhoGAP-domain-containing protein [Phanerochaete sordida]